MLVVPTTPAPAPETSATVQQTPAPEAVAPVPAPTAGDATWDGVLAALGPQSTTKGRSRTIAKRTQRSLVLLPRTTPISTQLLAQTVVPRFARALPLPRMRASSDSVPPRRTGHTRQRAATAGLPQPAEVPDRPPAPTQAGGAASAPPAGGGGGAFAGFGGYGQNLAPFVQTVKHKPAEIVLADGNKITLAIDRPG